MLQCCHDVLDEEAESPSAERLARLLVSRPPPPPSGPPTATFQRPRFGQDINTSSGRVSGGSGEKQAFEPNGFPLPSSTQHLPLVTGWTPYTGPAHDMTPHSVQEGPTISNLSSDGSVRISRQPASITPLPQGTPASATQVPPAIPVASPIMASTRSTLDQRSMIYSSDGPSVQPAARQSVPSRPTATAVKVILPVPPPDALRYLRKDRVIGQVMLSRYFDGSEAETDDRFRFLMRELDKMEERLFAESSTLR